MINNEPSKNIEELDDKELYEFRNSLDPNALGFEEEKEGANSVKNKQKHNSL